MHNATQMVFAPWGRGFGHTARALALIDAADRAGYNARLLRAPERSANDAELREARTIAFERQDPWDVWRDAGTLSEMVELDIAACRSMKPDVIVVDGRISMIIAAETLRIPVVTIVRDSYAPTHEYVRGGDGFWQSMMAPLDRAIARYGIAPVADPRELFVRHPSICPSTREIEDFPPGTPLDRMHFSGLITWRSIEAEAAHDIGPEDVLVYGVLRIASDVDRLVSAFAGTSYRLVVAMPTREVEARISLFSPERVVARSYLQLEEIGPLLGGAIIHGGHGICLTVLMSGTRAVIVPPADRIEQRANGARLQRLGRGVVLNPLEDWARIPALLARQEPAEPATSATSLHDRLRAAVEFIARVADAGRGSVTPSRV